MLMMMMMLMMIAMLMKIQPLNARTLRGPESKPQHFTGNCSLASLVRRSGCGAQTHTSVEGHEAKRYCSWDQHQKIICRSKNIIYQDQKNSHRNRRGRSSSSSSSSSSSRAWYLLHVGMFTEFHLGSFRASCRVSLGFHVGFHSGFHLGVHLGLHLGFHLEGFIEGYI